LAQGVCTARSSAHVALRASPPRAAPLRRTGMPRERPTPLADEAAFVVKNTFLEEASTKSAAARGLLTAPASFVGLLKRSMDEGLSDAANLSHCKAMPTTLIVEADRSEIETTASTPSAAETNHLWPPTPASPHMPVRISLMELMGERDGMDAANAAWEEASSAAQALVMGATQMMEQVPQGFQQAPYWEMPPMLDDNWHYTAPCHPPPPPVAAPDLRAFEGAEVEYRLSEESPPTENRHVYACVANAPAPKCAPPCAPAPVAAPSRPSAQQVDPPEFDVAEAPPAR